MKIFLKFCVMALVATVLAVAIFAVERSGKWVKVRADHIKMESVCQWCGQKDIKKLEVHHIVPFHDNPRLELEPKNLISFCRFCHFVVGHNCNWENDNVNCRRECVLHVKNKAKRQGGKQDD